MRFEFATATRIIFGDGAIKDIGGIVTERGTKALVVTGKNTERAKPLTDVLDAHGVGYEFFSVSGEPTTDVAQAGTELARETGCDLVVGFGGGSALDTGKAVSALLTNGGDIFDYLEVIGQGKKLEKAAAPYIAVPTTAGTGTEVTKNAVLMSEEHRVKVSLRSVLMIPDVALVDPELTYSMPPSVTALTGLDALTQVLEPYVSHLANPLTDAICREGLTRAARSLRVAYTNGDNAGARRDMALASLFGGLALANAKLGAVHGFAGPFGGMFDAPHGGICASLLPHVMEVNLKVLRNRDPQNPALARYDEIGRILTGKPGATAEDGVAWVQETVKMLNVPKISEWGYSSADLPALLEKAGRSSSMKGNPIKLTDDEMTEILEAAS